MQKINVITFHSWYIPKISHTHFEYFRYAWSSPPKMIVSTCGKLRCLSAPKINFIPHVFLEILQKLCKLIILGTWAWLALTTKLIASTCRKVRCLSACKKPTLSLPSFLRCCKGFVILLLTMATKNDISLPLTSFFLKYC